MNVAFDACVPVITADDKNETLSVLDVLVNAKNIRAINAPPAVVYGLINLLAALIAHMLRIKTLNGLIKASSDYGGGLDAKMLCNYFKRYGERFEMFQRPKNGKGHPFLQPCDPIYLQYEKAWINIRALYDCQPRIQDGHGANKVIYFSVDPTISTLTPQETVCALIAFQFFSPRGGPPTSFPKKYDKLHHRSAPAWAKGGSMMPICQTLLETLFCNIDLDGANANDAPSWAIDDPGVPNKPMLATVRGPMHRATLPHHWVLIKPPAVDGVVETFVHPSSYHMAFDKNHKEVLPVFMSIGTGKKVEPYLPRPDNWKTRHGLMAASAANGKLIEPPVRLGIARSICADSVLGVGIFFAKPNAQSTTVKYTIEDHVNVLKAPPISLTNALVTMSTFAEDARVKLRWMVIEAAGGRRSDVAKKCGGSAAQRFMNDMGIIFEREYPRLLVEAGADKLDYAANTEAWRVKVKDCAMSLFERLTPRSDSTQFPRYFEAKLRLAGMLANLGKPREDKKARKDGKRTQHVG